jgi:hypothetical protein
VAGCTLNIRVPLVEIVFVKMVFSILVFMVAVQAVQKRHVVFVGKIGRGLFCFLSCKKVGNTSLSISADCH